MTMNGKEKVMNPQPDVRSLVSYLGRNLGPMAVGAMCGLEGAAPLSAWMVRPPDVETEAKLRIGYQVTKGICDREGMDMARAWLVGMNPQLCDENPLFEIGKGSGQDVLIAARVYLQDPSLT